MRHYYVDRIESITAGERAVGVKAIALSDDAFSDHFPGNPIYPGVFLIEGMAQTAGLLLYRSTEQMAVMASIDRVRFITYARPGECVRFAVNIESLTDERATRVRGVATVDGREICSGRFTFRLVQPESLVSEEYWPQMKRAYAVWLGEFPDE